MGKTKFETTEKAFKQEHRRLTEEEKAIVSNEINSNIGAGTQLGNTIREIREGNFSHLGTIPKTMLYYLAEEYYEHNSKRMLAFRKGQKVENSQQLKEELNRNKMNPLFRLSHSLYKLDDEEYLRRDDIMNSRIILDTLNPPTSEQKEAILSSVNGNKSKAIDVLMTNVENQTLMARNFFLAQIANTYVVNNAEGVQKPNSSKHSIDETDIKSSLNRDYSSLFSYTGRTAYILPNGDSSQVDNMFDAMMNNPTVFGRSFATHSMSIGKTADSFTESKGVSAAKNYGMNIAIGGIGNTVFGSTMAANNLGDTGHMYIKTLRGGSDKLNVVMFGAETSAPGHSSAIGKVHDKKAAKSPFSNTCAVKKDGCAGREYAGRIVDLSGFSADQVSKLCEDFTKYYRGMMIDALDNPESAKRIQQANEMMIGKEMNATKIIQCMNLIGMPKTMCMEHFSAMRAGNHFNGKGTPSNDIRFLKEGPKQEKMVKPYKRTTWDKIRAFFSKDYEEKLVQKEQSLFDKIDVDKARQNELIQAEDNKVEDVKQNEIDNASFHEMLKERLIKEERTIEESFSSKEPIKTTVRDNNEQVKEDVVMEIS